MIKEERPSSQTTRTKATAFVKEETKKSEPSILYGISNFFDALFQDCPQQHKDKAPPQDKPFLIIGHRGAPADEVENTIPSFELALERGANALEFDLCITADHEVVLWHDWDPDTIAAKARHEGLEPVVAYTSYAPEDEDRQRPVGDLKLSELREWYGYCHKNSFEPVDSHIPLFDEFIDWYLGEGTPLRALFLDVKIPEERLDLIPPFMQRIKQGLERCGNKTTIVMESMNKKVVKEMQSHLPSVNYSYDIEFPPGIVLFPGHHSAVKEAIAMGNDYAIAMRPRAITLAPWATYRRLIAHDASHRQHHNEHHPHRRIEGLVGATVNDPEEMECLIDIGINGLQTDLPELLKEIVEEKGLEV